MLSASVIELAGHDQTILKRKDLSMVHERILSRVLPLHDSQPDSKMGNMGGSSDMLQDSKCISQAVTAPSPQHHSCLQ